MSFPPCDKKGDMRSEALVFDGNGAIERTLYSSDDCSGTVSATYSYDCRGNCIEDPERPGSGIFLKISAAGCEVKKVAASSQRTFPRFFLVVAMTILAAGGSGYDRIM